MITLEQILDIVGEDLFKFLDVRSAVNLALSCKKMEVMMQAHYTRYVFTCKLMAFIKYNSLTLKASILPNTKFSEFGFHWQNEFYFIRNNILTNESKQSYIYVLPQFDRMSFHHTEYSIIFGGGILNSNIYKLQLTDLSCKIIFRLQTPRIGHSIQHFQNYTIVSGGINDGSFIQNMEIWNGISTEIIHLPFKCLNHNSHIIKSLVIYFTGGVDENWHQISDIYYYDIKNKKWGVLPSLNINSNIFTSVSSGEGDGILLMCNNRFKKKIDIISI